MNQIPIERRRQIAEAHGVSDAYLYQCLRGLRDMEPGRALELETKTGGEVTRRMLVQKDWHRIWPDLITDEFPAPVGNVQPA